MYLKNLQLVNFKNHETAEFAFSPKVNGIVGENGCGKTNLLDAIHYLSFCKSYFSAQDSFSVRFGADFFALHGDFYSFDTQNSNRVSCTFKIAGRKIVKLNQKEYDRMSDHIGLYPLVMVSPYDNDIINEGSEVRRRFFDMIISQFDREYLHQLISYQKLIVQRNRLLKQMYDNRQWDEAALAVWDEQLVRNGAVHTMDVRPDTTGKIGVMIYTYEHYYPIHHERYTLVNSVPAGIALGLRQLKGYVSDFRYLFSEGGYRNLGGFKSLGSLYAPRWDWRSFWSITAFLSIILAFMNLLPIPGLDGGHLLFLLYEMVTGRKPSEAFLERAQMAGMLFLLVLIVYANLNDFL